MFNKWNVISTHRGQNITTFTVRCLKMTVNNLWTEVPLIHRKPTKTIFGLIQFIALKMYLSAKNEGAGTAEKKKEKLATPFLLDIEILMVYDNKIIVAKCFVEILWGICVRFFAYRYIETRPRPRRQHQYNVKLSTRKPLAAISVDRLPSPPPPLFSWLPWYSLFELIMHSVFRRKVQSVAYDDPINILWC